MFIGAYQNAVSGLTCTWFAYFVLSSPSRSAGRLLERPVGLVVLDRGDLRLDGEAEGLDDLVRIAVGLRRRDHCLKYGLRTIDELLRFGLYDAK